MGATVIVALSHTVIIIEAAVAVVIVGLLVAILVMSQRKKRPAQPAAPAQAPSASYYADLEQKPSGQADPFASLTTTPSVPQPDPFAAISATPSPATPGAHALGAQPVGATAAVGVQTVSAPPVPAAVPAAPPAGTPPGWLPDPSGAPDTLRYWDGNAWTPHFAQRA